MRRNTLVYGLLALAAGALAAACSPASSPSAWEVQNPIEPLPAPPLGITSTFSELKDPPTPARVRLGRWLYFDARLSANHRISCATCHIPADGFSMRTAVATGIDGRKGTRKSPSFENEAWTLAPFFFWDGRAASLEEQALGPIANPVEMGNTHAHMVQTVASIRGYAPYFQEAFGTPGVTAERVARAIADYERTVMSGNSPYDRWRLQHDESAVSASVKRGYALFFGKAACNQCHLGQNFTDSRFHNIGVGWNPAAKTFADEGRYAVTHQEADRGAFKTPGLRDVALHPPYMHDGSLKSLEEVVDHYNQGGDPNPYQDPRIRPLHLTDQEVHDLVAMMEALTGGTRTGTRVITAFPQ
ncbi:MAG TPA: cytochrome c peroxidase [Vicinamibacterales bacterium]|nr:cytochrome c peroxidase [Vicinamibacterales bacterium]